MHPWLLQHPPVSTYGVCLVAAFMAAWLWARRRGRRAGVEPSRVDLLMPVVLGAGLLGAWLFGRWTDALTGEAAHSAVLVGSLLVATAVGIGYALWARLPLGVLGDIVAPPLALGMGLGRVGCFFAGCCFGKVCVDPLPLLAVRFPAGSFAAILQGREGASLPVYPVQLYESAGCVLLALAMWRWRARDERGITGQKFLALGIGYGLLRFGLEFLRADNPPIAGLTFSQWGAVGMVALAAGTWVVRGHYAQALGVKR